MAQIKPSELPKKIRIFILDEVSGAPLRGVPIQLVLSISTNTPNTPNVPSVAEISLGLLASNHVGYMAFDLKSKLASLHGVPLGSIHAVVPIGTPLRIDLADRLLSPLSAQPISANSNLINKLPTSANADPGEVITISLPGTLASRSVASNGLNSIQNPDITDWLLSPGSFGTNPLPAIGEDGCETLLPSHVPERIVRFHQLIQTPNPTEFPSIPFKPQPSYNNGPTLPNWPNQLYYRTGELHHYELIWFPLNHGLGQVLYSLTLAPCEAVRLAIVDWTRTEEAARTDQINLIDNLTHSLRRDRSIEETVNAVLRERQSGDSFMGGMAGVGGYGGGMGGGGMGMPTGGSPMGGSEGNTSASGPSNQGGGQQAGQNWGVTGSHALGYAMANSSGDREVDVNTMQDLADEISQASQLVRDLRSTVIVQANQSEREAVQTRIVRNHNHSHALTVLYYEVVRHYLVRVIHRRRQPVIFIKYPVMDFDENNVLFYTSILKRHLLDQSLINNFTLLERRDDHSSTDMLSYFNNGIIRQFVVTITAADDAVDNRDRLYLMILSASRPTTLEVRFPPGKIERYSTLLTTLTTSDPTLRYKDIVQVGLFYSVEGDGEARERAAIQYLDVKVVVELNGVPKLLDLLEVSEYYKYEHTSTFWKEPNRKPDTHAMTAQAEKAEREIRRLISHMNFYKQHYNAVIWLEENNNVRASRFADYQLGGVPLIEAVHNRPIQVVGDYVAFPLSAPDKDLPEGISLKAERIVSLPTRGAFAEAKLSHCNASEVIDDTRFWDWQISPCPDEPTDISPISLGSRRSPSDISPASMPPSGVNITEPETAPEPFGIREVMQLLRTPEVFRNMSGTAELGSLLEKLAEVAGEVEKARIGATTQLATSARSESPATRPSTGSPGGTSEEAVESPRRPSPQTVAREIANATRAIETVQDPERRNQLQEELAEREVRRPTHTPSAPRREPSASQSLQVENHALIFHFKDHKGAPLAIHGIVICYDVQTGQAFHENIGSLLAGESVARLPAVPETVEQIRLELLVEDIYLNVISVQDLDNIDRLMRGDIRVITGSRRISVAEVIPSGPLGGGRFGRMLGQDGTFTLNPENLAAYSFTVQLASETRTITREDSNELRTALEGQVSTALSGELGAVEISLGQTSEESETGGSSITINTVFAKGHFDFIQRT